MEQFLMEVRNARRLAFVHRNYPSLRREYFERAYSALNWARRAKAQGQ